jgi:DNA-binding CsgD family transcriptional regulator
LPHPVSFSDRLEATNPTRESEEVEHMAVQSGVVGPLALASERTTAAILDHLGLPIMLVEADGAVLYANQAAETLLHNHNLIRTVDSILRARNEPDGDRLKSAIAGTCSNGTGRVVVLGADGASQPVVALVLPFERERPTDRSRALVLLRSGKGLSEILINSLRRLFRLSPAEASIAVALGTGMDLNELAGHRHVKLNTLRSQVASIMAKTGTRRQAQLVALVTRIDSLL